jgi:hypothetical protein
LQQRLPQLLNKVTCISSGSVAAAAAAARASWLQSINETLQVAHSCHMTCIHGGKLCLFDGNLLFKVSNGPTADTQRTRISITGAIAALHGRFNDS